MTRSRFLVVELLLVASGLGLLAILFGIPSLGGGDSSQSAVEPAVVDTTTGPDAVSVDVLGAVPEREDEGEAAEEAGDGVCGPETGSDFLSGNQVVSFYGNPYTADLGILGALPTEEMLSRLREQSRLYDEANGIKGVQPALHLVSSTAQPEAGADGNHVLHVDMQTLDEWAELACREDLILFLDIQAGHSDLVDEIERIRPFLELPNVHLALDPEFAMAEGEIPGQAIGGYTAEEINTAQEMLRGIVEEKGIPDKMLVVHQFEIGMIERPWDIAPTEHVAAVVVMDGFGDPQTKVRQYKTYSQPVEYGGIKLFYNIDQPLMTEAEVAALHPSVVIYQ